MGYGGVAKIKVIKKRVEELIPYSRNSRTHSDAQVAQIAASIREFGFMNPVLVDAENNIIAGHGRVLAARKLGLEEVPCVLHDHLTETQRKAYILADNRLALNAGWDDEMLALELGELGELGFDLELTGFSLDEIEELQVDPEPEEGLTDEDAVPEVQDDPISKPGDIWLLGQHRLMCGDSTNEVDFEKLMDGGHAQCAVTSPPYGVGKEYEKAGIEPWFETIKPVIKNLCRHADIVCWNLSDLYATGSQFIEPTSVYSVNMFADNGYRPIWIRIWKKQGMNFGVSPYHLVSNKPVQQYEYISAFSKNGEAEEYNDQEYVWLSAFAGHGYKFVKRLTKEERKKWGYAGIWEMTTVRANKEHPAMFPVELPWRCLKMHSDRGGIALEPFSGSGTTIIAAEKTERRCYAMEISPVYCDLAVKRWQDFTGKQATLEATGETFEDVSHGREAPDHAAR